MFQHYALSSYALTCVKKRETRSDPISADPIRPFFEALTCALLVYETAADRSQSSTKTGALIAKDRGERETRKLGDKHQTIINNKAPTQQTHTHKQQQ